MKRLIKPKPIWIALILSLFVHFFLISRFNYLLEGSSNKKIMEKSNVAHISLKLKTNLSFPIENPGVLDLKSVPDFQNIENRDAEKQIPHMEEKNVGKELPVEEIIQDNRDKKEITEDFTQKGSMDQAIEEEAPQSLVETKEKIHQIKQEPEKELLSNKMIPAKQVQKEPLREDKKISMDNVQPDKNRKVKAETEKSLAAGNKETKKNPEVEEILDFTRNNYPDNVNPPELLEFQRPVYPKNLRERDIEGKVILKILIDKEGRVQEIQIFESSGYKGFDQIAIKSVRQWRFKPAKKENQQKESRVLIPINFQIK